MTYDWNRIVDRFRSSNTNRFECDAAGYEKRFVRYLHQAIVTTGAPQSSTTVRAMLAFAELVLKDPEATK